MKNHTHFRLHKVGFSDNNVNVVVFKTSFLFEKKIKTHIGLSACHARFNRNKINRSDQSFELGKTNIRTTLAGIEQV